MTLLTPRLLLQVEEHQHELQCLCQHHLETEDNAELSFNQ